MTALYIILGIILFTVLVLALRASLVISFSRDILHMYLHVGPVKIQISPAKQKKINLKKSAKTMQGKKLSSLYDVKKKTQAEKKSGKKSAVSKLKKLVVEEGNGSDGRQMIEFTGSDGKKVKKFYEAEDDSTSYFLKNAMEEAMEEFGDSLEVNQKVAVLVQMIEKLTK